MHNIMMNWFFQTSQFRNWCCYCCPQVGMNDPYYRPKFGQPFSYLGSAPSTAEKPDQKQGLEGPQARKQGQQQQQQQQQGQQQQQQQQPSVSGWQRPQKQTMQAESSSSSAMSKDSSYSIYGPQTSILEPNYILLGEIKRELKKLKDKTNLKSGAEPVITDRESDNRKDRLRSNEHKSADNRYPLAQVKEEEYTYRRETVDYFPDRPRTKRTAPLAPVLDDDNNSRYYDSVDDLNSGQLGEIFHTESSSKVSLIHCTPDYDSGYSDDVRVELAPGSDRSVIEARSGDVARDAGPGRSKAHTIATNDAVSDEKVIRPVSLQHPGLLDNFVLRSRNDDTPEIDRQTGNGTVKLLPSDVRRHRIWLRMHSEETKSTTYTTQSNINPSITNSNRQPFEDIVINQGFSGNNIGYPYRSNQQEVPIRIKTRTRSRRRLRYICRKSVSLAVGWLVFVIVFTLFVGFGLGFIAGWFGRH